MHPGNGLLLPAQSKRPPGAILFLTALLLKIQRGKKSRQGQASCTMLFIQPQRGKTRVRWGGWGAGRSRRGCQHRAGAAARPAAGANRDLPTAARAGVSAPASFSAALGGEAGSDGRERCLLQRGCKQGAAAQRRKQGWHLPTGGAGSGRSQGTLEAPLPWRHGGTQSCQSPGLGPRRILPLEGLPLPAAGSLTPPAQLQRLLLKLPPCFPGTGMLQPHHPPGFPPARSPSRPVSPQGGQCHTGGTFPCHPFKPTTLAHAFCCRKEGQHLAKCCWDQWELFG